MRTMQEIRDKCQKESPDSIPTSKMMQEWAKEVSIDFAEWTAKGLWSTHGGMWYEYQNNDNPITGEYLFDLYLQEKSSLK